MQSDQLVSNIAQSWGEIRAQATYCEALKAWTHICHYIPSSITSALLHVGYVQLNLLSLISSCLIAALGSHAHAVKPYDLLTQIVCQQITHTSFRLVHTFLFQTLWYISFSWKLVLKKVKITRFWCNSRLKLVDSLN